jgi:hypothetical protein
MEFVETALAAAEAVEDVGAVEVITPELDVPETAIIIYQFSFKSLVF